MCMLYPHAIPARSFASSHIYHQHWLAMALFLIEKASADDFTKRSQYVAVDKRLSQNFKKASSGMILPLFVALLSLSFCEKQKPRGAVIFFSISAVASLFFNTLALIDAGKIPEKPANGGDPEKTTTEERCRVRHLCIAAIVSNFMLVCMAASLATVLSPRYLWLAAPVLVLFLPLFGILIRLAWENGLEWGAVKYEEHPSDFAFSFDVASEVTQTALSGLSAAVFGHFKSGQCGQKVDIKAAESLVLFATLLGLAMMLLCCVPPSMEYEKLRSNTVKVLFKSATYFLMLLLAVAGFVAAVQIVGGYAVLPFVIFIPVATFWLLMAYRRAPEIAAGANSETTAGSATANREKSPAEQSLLWFGFYTAMFGALMASYSASTTGEEFGVLYKTLVCFIFAALVSNLARVVLVREARGKLNEHLVYASGVLTIVLMTLTVAFALIVVMKAPKGIRNTFVSAGTNSTEH